MEYVQWLEVARDVAQQLEGPYRWHIVGAFLFITTAIVSRFIFKTFKWFVLLVLIGGLLVAGARYFVTI